MFGGGVVVEMVSVSRLRMFGSTELAVVSEESPVLDFILFGLLP